MFQNTETLYCSDWTKTLKQVW